MSGGFFRGTSAEQDTRFSNKQAKLLKSQKFAAELEHLVDITKVKMDVMKPWIAKRVTEIIGFEDEVLINFIYGLLDGKIINGKEVQISLTGFMERNTGKFMKELWTLLLSAQNNASGVPQEFLDAKEEETKKKKAEKDRIAKEIQRKQEKENQETEQEKNKSMDGDNNIGRGNSEIAEPAQKQHTSRADDEDPRGTNGSGRRRGSRSRSISRSFSGSRSYSGSQKSRNLSGSPPPRSRSISSKRLHRSLRRSVTPRRGRSPRPSLSPPRHRSSHSRQRSISHSRHRSPSPARYRRHSPLRRRSPSPMRRMSRSPIGRSLRSRSRSPAWRRSTTPIRRRSPAIHRRSPSPMRRRNRKSPSSPRRRSPSPVRRRRSPSPLIRHTSPSRSPPPMIRHTSPSRSPPPIRRHRSPSPSPVRRRRSPSPVTRRRSPSPVRRRRSPSPVRRLRSPFPVRRRRSPSPVRLRRSPASVRRRRSPSPVRHRRSPSPNRRHRSPSPIRRRSLLPGRRISVTPVRHRSPSPDESSSSPVRRSSINRRSLKGRGSSPISPDESLRSRENYSPHYASRRGNTEHTTDAGKGTHKLEPQPRTSLRSPQRDLVDGNDSRKKVPSSRSSPVRSLSVSGSPSAPSEKSPAEERTRGKMVHVDKSIPSGKPRERPDRVESSETSEDEKEPKYNRDSRQKNDSLSRKTSSTPDHKNHEKDKSSFERSAGHRSNVVSSRSDDLESNKNEEMISGKKVGRVDLPDSPLQQGSASRRVNLLSERERKSHDVTEHRAGEKNQYRYKGTDQRVQSNDLAKLARKVEQDDQSSSEESGSEGSERHRSKIKEKRKHKRSKRHHSDDSSYDSDVEERKEAKRRRREEKRLRKEEKRRRREERRRKREERREEKLKSKSTRAVTPPSDIDETRDNHTHERTRKRHGDVEEMESEQKKLEIELREKALESLRAKKGIGR